MIFNVKKFKELRKLHKMTAKDVSDETGISSSAIYGYESKRAQPSQDILESFAKLFKVEVSDLQISESEIKNNNVSDMYNVWKDETVKHLKSENERLWLLVQKLTGAQVADLGKLTASIMTTKEAKIVPFYTGVTKQSA